MVPHLPISLATGMTTRVASSAQYWHNSIRSAAKLLSLSLHSQNGLNRSALRLRLGADCSASRLRQRRIFYRVSRTLCCFMETCTTNVLNFGLRGWLAIDPKGLIGERCFDYANIFCNPDPEMATMPGRLSRQVRVVAEAAHLERHRLLTWIVAWAGLSAAFLVDDGLSPNAALTIVELAATELNR